MGSGKGGDGVAEQERADEQARQARIKKGTGEINKIFDGSDVGSNALAAGAVYDPTAKYYNADGTVYDAKPAGGLGGLFGNATGATPGGSIFVSGGASGGGSGGTVVNQTPGAPAAPTQSAADRAAAQFAKDVAAGKVYGGTTHNGGFDDTFWNGRRQSYLDYGLPQVTDQFGDANKQLTFALDRAGTLDSSIRGQKLADLQKLYDKNITQVNDQANDYVNQGKTGVEDARSNLIATLNATGDAQGAANSALARAGTLSKAPVYSPLTNLFDSFTSLLGNNQAQNLSYQVANGYGGGGAPSSSGLYKNTGSVKVT